MSVTAFQDLPLADRDREWDGAAAEKRVRRWADATEEPNQKYRDAHVWYDSAKKDNFTSYKLLIADVIDGQLRAVPRGVMAAGAVMQGSRGGVDLPDDDIDRVKSHLAKYYAKMGDSPPWDKDLSAQLRSLRASAPDSSASRSSSPLAPQHGPAGLAADRHSRRHRRLRQRLFGVVLPA